MNQESGINSKSETNQIRIVWICGFSNERFGKRFGFESFEETAPWISNLISIFENNNLIELHVIAPNIYSNINSYFIENEIHFHFFRHTWTQFRKILNKLRINEISNYYFQRKRVSEIIRSINPDVIHLHGSENPVYAASILDNFKKYQSLVTIQGFISHETKVNNYFIRKRIRCEQKILKSLTNFGVRTDEMCNVISDFNNNAVFHWHNYPITKPLISNSSSNHNYKYDCVSFARMSVENGMEDFLLAISIVKKTNNNIRCALIGPIGAGYKQHLICLSEELGISENIHIAGYFENQQLAFNEVALAKMDVLCTYYDIIPGTILEAMYIGTPVIAYSVGGIPELNKERKSLLLVEKGNIQQLAESICLFLSDESFRHEIASNAKVTVRQYFDNKKIYDDLIKIYQDLGSHKSN